MREGRGQDEKKDKGHERRNRSYKNVGKKGGPVGKLCLVIHNGTLPPLRIFGGVGIESLPQRERKPVIFPVEFLAPGVLFSGY